MVTLVKNDLEFILQQILLSEAHSGAYGTPSVPLTELIPNPLLPWGVRTVDGTFNNIIAGRETWGSADLPFPRLTDPSIRTGTAPTTPFDINGPAPGGVITNTNYSSPASVVDTAPRTISNLIADQTTGNLAALIKAFELAGSADPFADAQTVLAAPPADRDALAVSMGLTIDNGTIVIENVAPDDGISAPFNSWMTLFGQFFDHGLDLVEKNSTSKVYIPLQPDDPLITVGPDGIPGSGDEVPPERAFMVVTRTLPDAANVTTPFVDQNQTYTSHASHQVFLREYEFSVDTDSDNVADSRAVSTGKLLEGHLNGQNGGLATWADVKLQAQTMLGITLADINVLNVPLLATDLYGKFIPGANGYAQVMVEITQNNGTTTTTSMVRVEGRAGGLDINNLTAADIATSPDFNAGLGAITGIQLQLTGHAFLDDIAHSAAPAVGLPADADGDTGNAIAIDPLTGQRLEYDNELLDRHFITGDGRGNENIGLTTVHHVFHSEHNRMADHIKDVVLQSGDLAFINQWLDAPVASVPVTPAEIAALDWNGERLFQAARFSTEMQYQHMVFEEFGRKVNPMIDLFVFNPTMDVNPAIFAEFAHVVYRFGHSMLTETVARLGADGQTSNDIGLIQAFLNPVEFDSNHTISANEAAGAIIRGMTRQAGNEIDEFVTEALRNNLLGLPLDLASINLARGRETGMPTLQEARAQFYAGTSTLQGTPVEWLKPYTSWTDFALHLKNPASIINFIAAYGTHAAITTAVTLEDKRKAAIALVFGDNDGTPNTVTVNGIDVDISDRASFLNATGTHAGGTLGGLNNVDFWIGGLAEAIMPFGGMLGSTFSFVFEKQMENLQNGDRFYYLSRTQGLNFLTELENNSFAKIVMKNTDLGQLHDLDGAGPGTEMGRTHLPGELFARVDYILEWHQTLQEDYNPAGPGIDPVHSNPILQMLEPKVARDLHLTYDGITYDRSLKFTGGEHVVLGGTTLNDVLIAHDGDDTLWGDEGNDLLIGGHGINRLHGGDGDDIIFDGGDISFLHGEAGNDVISAGGGLGELIFGGDGNDWVSGNIDGKEVFGGNGNDFILGSPDVDFLLGGAGDDWIEGGEGFDTIAGENSQLFFNSDIIGHDVMFAGTNEQDFDAESGDDIMVQGESVMRNEGMLGFDWVSFEEHTFGVTVDMNVKIFTTVFNDILRNRFDRVEALSGTAFNDDIIGDSRVSPLGPFNPAIPVNEQSLEGDELTVEGVNRINGLNEILGISQAQLDAMNPTDVVFNAGNILLGGGGSDAIEGRGGDDFIDGDAWLNVRIAIVDGNGNEIGTAEKMQGIVSSSNPAWNGRTLESLVLTRQVNPGQLTIVREILDGNRPGDVDVARFSDVQANYEIIDIGNGDFTVRHRAFDGAGNEIVGENGIDGFDTVRNIEFLQFADSVINVGNVPNNPAEGLLGLSLTVDGLQPGVINVGDRLTVNLGTVTDADGLPALSTFTFSWQFFDELTGQWIALLDPVTELPITGLSLTITDALALDIAGEGGGGLLRVVGAFRDGNGVPEFVLSTVAGPVVSNAPAVPDPAADLGAIAQGDVDGILITLDQLLANATDPDTPINQLVVLSLTPRDPLAGTVTGPDANGNFTFIPNPDFVGGVVFDFEISDGTHVTAAEAILDVVATGGVPLAVADVVNGVEDTALNINQAVLLANDATPNPGPLVVDSVTNGTGGTVTLNAGVITFTPTPDFAGVATFTYTVFDGIATSGPATVTVNVAAVNDAPTAILPANASISENAPNGAVVAVLGTTDVDTGDFFSYTLLNDPSGGAFEIVGNEIRVRDGSLLDFDTLPNAYTLSVQSTDSGGLSVVQNVVVSLLDVNEAPTAITPDTATIAENAPNGTVVATLAANDPEGGPVTFTLLGDAMGRFSLVGNQIVIAAASLIDFEAASSHTLRVMATDAGGLTRIETITVQVTDVNEAPTIVGTAGADRIDGTNGTDRVVAGAGNDRVRTFGGDDFIDGGAGADRMNGGVGNDTYVVDNTGDQITEGGNGGNDTVQTTLLNYVLGANLENLHFIGVGNFVGVGNAAANVLTGRGGNDQLQGGGGNDTMISGAGNDTMSGGDGNDKMYGGAGQDLLQGNAGNDTLHGAAGNDTMLGGTGDDLIVGGDGDDVLNGEAGNDTIFAGAGNDTVTGGAGNDVFRLTNAPGTTVISDFGDVAGNDDVLSFSITDFANFAAVQAAMTQVGANVRIDVAAGSVVVLTGVNIATLDASDFSFV